MIKLEVKNMIPLIKMIQKNGKDKQKLIAMEELAELQQAISHDMRGREHNVAEEMADVYIMLAELQYMYDNGIEVQNWIDTKVFRLTEMVGGVEDGAVVG